MDPKRKDEKRHIDALRNLLEEFPEGEIRINPNDPPDVEIMSENVATHAIEHSRLYRPPDGKGIRLQGQETERVRVVEKAREIYEQRGGVPVFVSVDFREVFGLQRNPNIALSKRKRETLAKTIADLVGTANLNIDEETVIEPRPGGWQSWPKEIDDIFVARYSWLKTSQWAPEMGGVVPRLTPELIQERVDEKQAKLQIYAGRYPHNWLVLVELGTNLSSDFDLAISKEALTHTYQSSFDRIIFLRYLRQQVFNLRTATKDGGLLLITDC